jgi:murein L,D-transpeptidase YafK
MKLYAFFMVFLALITPIFATINRIYPDDIPAGTLKKIAASEIRERMSTSSLKEGELFVVRLKKEDRHPDIYYSIEDHNDMERIRKIAKEGHYDTIVWYIFSVIPHRTLGIPY